MKLSNKSYICIVIFCLVVFCGGRLNGQIGWQKDSTNPVLQHWSGEADDPSGYKYAFNPTVFFDDKLYRMWFSSLALGIGTSFCVSEAVSIDGKRWYVDAKNPALRPGSPGSFDSRHLRHPGIIVGPSDYKLYYAGYNDQRFEIGLAYSNDGLTWIKHPSNPVLRVGPSGNWDAATVRAPVVMYDGGMYKMWYMGEDGVRAQTGYATSPDGITWTKYSQNPVLAVGPPGAFDATGAAQPGIIRVDNTYHMIYTGINNQAFRLGYAYSSDGITWQKYSGNPVLFPGDPGAWDDYQIGAGTLLYQNETLYLWYSGNNYIKGWWQTGLATAPLAPLQVQQESSVPKSFAVYQSYPNPFNPTTTIRFDIPKETHVKITIYNSLGQEVETLIDGRRSPGKHSLEWNAHNVASGMYWYRVEFSTLNGECISESKKLIVLK